MFFLANLSPEPLGQHGSQQCNGTALHVDFKVNHGHVAFGSFGHFSSVIGRHGVAEKRGFTCGALESGGADTNQFGLKTLVVFVFCF